MYKKLKNKYLSPLRILLPVVIFGLCGCRLIFPHSYSDSVTVDGIYGSRMVLQRDVPIHIGGSGESDKKIRVELLDEQGNVLSCKLATVNTQGRWDVYLPKMPAGGPYSLRISGSPSVSPLVFDNILIGDVWICSGQSNMEMPVYSPSPEWRDEHHEAILADVSKYPNIRLFNESLVKTVSPLTLNRQPKGMWTLADEETVKVFSATAYQFGVQLSKDMPDVPIGLVNVSWSGTQIEPWISEEAYRLSSRAKELEWIQLAHLPSESERVNALETLRSRFIKDRLEWIEKYQREASEANPESANWKMANYDDSQWLSLDDPMVFLHVGETGTAWARKTIDVPENWLGHDLILELCEIDDCDWTFVNGKQVGQTLPDVDNYWGVKRIYQIPANLVNTRRLVLAVRFANLYGVGGIAGPSGPQRRLYLASDERQAIDINGPWKFKMEYAVDTEKFGGLPKDNLPQLNFINSPQFPSTLFNSMIYPWTFVPVRGVIWYQGCSNAENATDYLTLHRLLIEDWRRAWKNSRLPFIITQLSAFGPFGNGTPDAWKKDPPASSGYGALRESQLLVHQCTPYTGLAVTIDSGLQYDIHPHNKTIVGYRLAKEAERLCYGSNDIAHGPIFKQVVFKDGKAVVSFDCTGKGLSARNDINGYLNGFVLAGPDGIFHHAKAVIDGDTVIVSSPEVSAPVAVRYAWISFADNLNFYNANGFPACPFRSDIPEWVRKQAK